MPGVLIFDEHPDSLMPLIRETFSEFADLSVEIIVANTLTSAIELLETCKLEMVFFGLETDTAFEFLALVKKSNIKIDG